MGLETSYREEKEYLLAQARGEFVFNDVYQGLLRTKERARQSGRLRIFIDAYEISAPKREFERFLLGKAIADLFPVPFKIAIYYKEELIDKVSENTAVSRGAHYFICGNKDQALQWLLEDDAGGQHF